MLTAVRRADREPDRREHRAEQIATFEHSIALLIDVATGLFFQRRWDRDASAEAAPTESVCGLRAIGALAKVRPWRRPAPNP
jgi:hypothetical protein